MRKLVLALVLLCTNSLQAAPFQYERIMTCDTLDKIFTHFTQDPYHEKPIWIGKDVGDPKSQFTLLANVKTGTWTFIQTNDTIGCVLAVGKGFTEIEHAIGDRI